MSGRPEALLPPTTAFGKPGEGARLGTRTSALSSDRTKCEGSTSKRSFHTRCWRWRAHIVGAARMPPPPAFSVGNWEAAWPMRPTAHFILPPRNSRDSATRRKCLLLGHHGILSPHEGRIVPAVYFLAIALGEYEHIFLFSSISPCLIFLFPW